VRRLRSQSGFTTIELLVTVAMLGVVAAGASMLVEVVMRQGRGVLERTESAQRGRLALDQMTRQVRSQVCLNETTKGMISATPTTLTFYADFSNGTTPNAVARRQLEYVPTSRQIIERVWAPANAPTPTRTTVLLQNVVQARDENAAGAPVLPFFRYWAYPDPMPVNPRPDQALSGTLTAAQVARIARVGISFNVRPATASSEEFATPLQDDIVLRNADPNAARPDPTCR
jgi:prepilin-type N-terminal cleavage/methylation domain-containing protein